MNDTIIYLGVDGSDLIHYSEAVILLMQGNGTPANVQASRASGQNMETMNDAGSAMSMRQVP